MKKSILTDKRLNISYGSNTVIHTLLKLGINRHELITYNDFINSKEWQIIRTAWFKKYKKRCLKCNKQRGISLHHIVYPPRDTNMMGTYRKVQDKHFIGLCVDCHNEYHKKYGVHQDMIKTSIEFVGKAKYNKLFNSPKRNRKNTLKLKKRKKHIKPKKIRKSMSVSDLLSF